MALRIRGLLLLAVCLLLVIYAIWTQHNPHPFVKPHLRSSPGEDGSPASALKEGTSSRYAPGEPGSAAQEPNEPVNGVIYLMFGHRKQAKTFRTLLRQLRDHLVVSYPIIVFYDSMTLHTQLRRIVADARKGIFEETPLAREAEESGPGGSEQVESVAVAVEEDPVIDYSDEPGDARQLDITIVHLDFAVPEFVPEEKVVESPAGFEGKLGTVGYRHMCRFYSGEVFRHPVLQKYDYAWRLDPDSGLPCSLPVDPFHVMKTKGYKYGYSLYFYDNNDISGDTLWKSINEYVKINNIVPKPGFHALAQRFPAADPGNFHRCHYWNNFELMDLNFFRSKAWLDLFDYLDHVGGFYEYRWGDALVRTMGVDLFAEDWEVYRFNEIAYHHGGARNTAKCENFDLEITPCLDGLCPHCNWLEVRFRGVDSNDVKKLVAGLVLVGGLVVVAVVIRRVRRRNQASSLKQGQE